MVQVQTDKECSKCGAINKLEVAYDKLSQSIFCTICKHKKVIVTVTTYSSTEGETTVIIPPQETTEKF